MKRTSKVFSVLLALIMVATMVPATVFAGAGSNAASSVKITMQASKGDEGFDFMRQPITVHDGIAEAYDYSVATEDRLGVAIAEPTVFDALVEAHIIKYGEAFKNNPTNYLTKNSAGTVTKAFERSTINTGYVVNEKMLADDDGWGYLADTSRLKNNDLLEFWFYVDDSTYLDFYTRFDDSEITTEANKEFTLKLKGCLALNIMMGSTTPAFDPVYNTDGLLGICPVNEDGTLGAQIAEITNEDGSITLSKETAGTYVFTALGFEEDYESVVTLPWCKVEVLPAGTIKNVEDLIKAVGAVTIDSSAKIKAARDAYDALSEGGKKLVTNYNVLAAAEGKYQKLEAAQKISQKKVTIKTKSAAYNKATISWNKISGVRGYEVYRATSKTGKYTKIKATTGTSYTNTGLKTGKTYYYKVRSYIAAEGSTLYGKYSTVKSAKPVPATPALKLKAGKKNVKATWKKVAGASGYQIYRTTVKNGKFKKIKTITKGKTVSYTNKKLKKGKTYYYKVRAYKTVSGKKVYGSFSKVVRAKAK